MKKIKLLVCMLLVLAMFGSLIGCSDEEGEKETNKEVTREDKMNDNKDIYIVSYYMNSDSDRVFYGVTGKGLYFELKTSKYVDIDNFYDGYAVAKESSSKYHLIDKSGKSVFTAADFDYEGEDYIVYKDSETGKKGLLKCDGTKVLDAKYDDINVYEVDDLSETFYAGQYECFIEADIDSTNKTEYYTEEGKLLFTGEQSGYYYGHNFRSEGFAVMGDAALDEKILYSYYTGKKVENIKNMYGAVAVDKEDKNYIVYDSNFNEVKKIPKENEDKEYSIGMSGKSMFALEYKVEKNVYASDIYNSKTGEFMFTVPADDLIEMYDSNGTQYILAEVKDEEGNYVVKAYDNKGTEVFTSPADSELSYKRTYNYFVVEQGENEDYVIYTTDGFKQVTTIAYEAGYDNDNSGYVFLNREAKKGLYITEFGKLYEFDLQFDAESRVYLDDFLLYDYALFEDNTGKQYVIDLTTGKVTFEVGTDYCTTLSIVPAIRMDGEYYNYKGKKIFDLEEMMGDM